MVLGCVISGVYTWGQFHPCRRAVCKSIWQQQHLDALAMAFSKVGEEGNKSIAAAMPQAPGLGEALGDQCSHVLSQMVRKNTWWCGVRAAFLWPLCFCSSWVCTWEQTTRQIKSIWSWKNTLTLHHGYSKSVPHLHQFYKIQRHKKKQKQNYHTLWQPKPSCTFFPAIIAVVPQPVITTVTYRLPEHWGRKE